MADGSTRMLDFGQELVVDLFAGGGGASLGIARAYRHPDVAVNHSPVAISVHAANHPETTHFACDVFEVDPICATRGRPVGVLWASPDCRHHSKAKGGRPRSKKVRALAWVVVRWAAACRPRMICLENVEEFADWGPLLADGRPCPVRRGTTFRRWVRQLERLGYTVEHRELVAADYGAPTIRKRLYLVARCDGRPIVWPNPTHSKTGAGGLPRWRAAAECIDWSLPARSIFDRPRPLAANTLRRIAKGLWRYVLASADPFIVPATHPNDARVHGTCEPFRTVTSANRGELMLARPILTPFLTEHANGSSQRTFAADEPLRTQVAQIKGGHFALASAFLEAVSIPADAIPPELRDRARQCAELLRTYLPDQFPPGAELVMVGDRILADSTLRMLAPRELARAQGFPDSYQLETGAAGEPITKTDQVRLIGNSVCPDVAEAIVRANAADLIALYARAAA